MTDSIQASDPESWEQVRYEEPAEGVARIVLARADARNAQGKRMTYELNAAFDRAAAASSSVASARSLGPSSCRSSSNDACAFWRASARLARSACAPAAADCSASSCCAICSFWACCSVSAAAAASTSVAPASAAAAAAASAFSAFSACACASAIASSRASSAAA